MPDTTVGLLTDNKELSDDFYDNVDNLEIRHFRSFESIKPDEFFMLAVDTSILETGDSIQFYLSKIRKKLQGIPVLLILRVTHLEKLNVDWFFDEFIVYPFRKGEIMSRIRILMWEKNMVRDENIITAGNLRINLKEYSVYLNNVRLDFTYKEFELLRFLVENKGGVFSRKDLLNKIWGVEYIGGTRTVDVHIRRLRGKLGEEFNTIIETVRNVGYRCRA